MTATIERLSIGHWSRPGLTGLRPKGQLGYRSAREVGRALVAALLNTGVVVVELDELEIEQASQSLIFASALVDAGGWPQARMVLCSGSENTVRIVTTSGVTRTVPYAATADAALPLLSVRPPRVRRRGSFEPRPDSVARARRMAADACTAWGITEGTTNSAKLIVSELVTNAVQHAQTACHLMVEYNGSYLSICASDDSGQLPNPQEPHLAHEGGRGLYLIDALSTRWGVAPRRDRKMVWAIVS